MLISACSGSNKSDNPESGNAATKSESDYCTTRNTFSTSVALTGTAEFYYRKTCPTTGAGCTSSGLSGNPISQGIPFAEVVITNSAGSVIQCTETDANGSISTTLPQTAGTYTVSVYSRANNTKIKVSVLEDTTENAAYSVSGQVTLAGSETSASAGTISAYARESESARMEGAAFHILWRLYQANEFIRTKISNSSWVAEKVSVYWKKGFNPYSYYGYPNSPLSFYANGARKLYILGGLNGDVKTSDTDHFDSSVILHEYAHFLDDVYGHSDSPGGSHNGNFIIDPRLAWSEGWANFFQAAVLKEQDSTWKYYVDTAGYSDDSVDTGESGMLLIRFDASESGGSATYDKVSLSGEGTFRELSVTRTLYKTILTSTGGAAIPFQELWNVFTNQFHSSSVYFRNIGLFNSYLRSIISSSYSSKLTDFDAVLSNEQQNASSKDFADTLTSAAENSCPTKAITPTVDKLYSSYYRSNQLTSNDFYLYTHDGTSKYLTIEYTGGSTNMDLDLVLYKQDYVYFEQDQETNGQTSSKYIARSVRAYSIDQGSETISLSSVPAGTYLINIRANTLNKTSGQLSNTANYRIKRTLANNSVEDLCPSH